MSQIIIECPPITNRVYPSASALVGFAVNRRVQRSLYCKQPVLESNNSYFNFTRTHFEPGTKERKLVDPS
jgi:hypothetical protein